MKKSLTLIAVLVAMALLLSECKTKSAATTTTTTTTTKAPDTTAPAPSPAELADINAGHTFFTTRCDQCHRQPREGKYGEAGWAKIMEKMGPLAKLTQSETDQVLKYLASINKK